MLPEGWKLGDFGSIGKWTGGGTPSKANDHFWTGGTIPWVSPKDMTSGKICGTEDYITPEAIKNSATRLYPAGSVMIVTRSGILRKKLPVAIAELPITVNQDLKVLPYNKQFSPEYVYNYILCFNNEILNTCAKEGTTVESIDTNSFLGFPIKLPPLPEQKKIAAILSTWDRAIEGTEKLLANSQQQKKALMQQLLTGKKRLAGFTGEWKLSPISAFIKESRVPGNSGDIAKKITIKLYGKGVFPKEEKREGSESTKYYKRKSGQFIYSKLDFLNGAFGIIPSSLDGYESTLDLPAFDFLHNVSSQWFIFYVSREEFYSANLGLANGGRKARRVNPSDLLRISVPTPPLPEQKAIAAVLTTADKEITAIESDLLRLRQEKKALMQQLLTGKRRVKVD
ncbi:restriction endonuclease subunit S [Acetobacter pasteurianus]